MGRRLSTIEETKEALVEIIEGIEEKMKITMPGTDYYMDLERQLEEFENQLLTLDDVEQLDEDIVEEVEPDEDLLDR